MLSALQSRNTSYTPTRRFVLTSNSNLKELSKVGFIVETALLLEIGQPLTEKACGLDPMKP